MARSQAPSFCIHRPTGQAYATLPLSRRPPCPLLGEVGTAQSLSRYESALKEAGYSPEQIAHAVQSARISVSMPQPVAKTPTAAPVTVRLLYDTFMRWAPTHYRLPNGSISGEVDNFRSSCTQFLASLGERRTDSLTKKDLEQVRQAMVEKGLGRKVVNQRISRIRHIIRWGTEGIRPSLHHCRTVYYSRLLSIACPNSAVG